MTTSENDELGARSASWFLLGRRDAYYLLSLLIPFFVYNLALKAVSVASIPGLALTFDLVRSDVFFHLGYALLFFGLFAVARGRRRFLHRVVVILFHASVMIEVVATTGTYLYLQQTETALDWDAIAGEIPPPAFSEIAPILTYDVPLSTWALLAAALLYAALGPLVVTRLVERWRGPPGRRHRRAAPARVPAFLGPLGLFLLALLFGSLSLLASSAPEDADGSFARDPLVNLVLTGVREEATTTEKEEAETTTTEEAGEPGTSAANGYSAANARLAETPQTEKRNVVLIHLESARAQSVTPYNEDLKTMPFLGELAKQSLVAERPYLIVPRSSKGSTAVNCGVEPALYAGPEYEPGNIPAPCLASLLEEQGYRAAWFQSLWDTGDDSSLAANFGYEEFYPSQSMNTEGFQVTNTFGFEDDVMLGPSEAWLRTYGGDGPFLAQYFTSGAHYGYDCVPNRYGYERFSEDEEVNRYLNCLRMLDFFLQNLFEQYQRLGLYEDTIFVLYGDHGEGFEQERGRAMHGDTIWDEGIKVPLIVHDPQRFQNGERATGLSSQIDVLPTVLDLLGYEVEGGEYPGYSLLDPVPEDRTLMSSCITNRRCMASIKGNEKYIYHYGDQPDEVFDLSKDPLEKNNLASEYSQEELDKRREELFAWRSRVNAQYGRILANGNPVLGEE